MDTVLQVWPLQCGVEGKDHFPPRAGSTISSLCSECTLLAHAELGVHQDHPGPGTFDSIYSQPLGLELPDSGTLLYFCVAFFLRYFVHCCVLILQTSLNLASHLHNKHG